MKATVSVYLFLCLCGLSSTLLRKHFYVTDQVTWQNAQTYCREHYDDLSTITKLEAEELASNPEVTEPEFWIGLYQNPANMSEWIWSGGEKQPVENWDIFEPNSEFENCATERKWSSKLNNVMCDLKLSFYCMKTSELILVNENKTWEEALEYCRLNYIDLVTIDSGSNMAEVIKNTMTSQTPYVWTGLRFLAGHWFWVSGEDVSYKAWSAGGELQCPGTNLQCGALDIANKVWKPTDCEKRLHFVCFNK
ncbi:putative C-type lectin domain family 20 member A [Paramisgurnus dabryanus]|uniref:putative C-type lectin domain family 20 member A n=1 Tax=Paramisgurnus dabryanus TaxID=90735 RepID=UPI0031F45102